MKTRTNITVEHDVVEKAKKLGLNISAVAERAIREKSGEVVLDTTTGTHCEICKREFPQETAKDVKQGSPENKLTWLYPDEIWICNSCLSHKMKLATVSQ